MNVFTVSLFGHRKIDNLQQVDNALFPIIQELMRTREYVSFLVGRSGEFDEYAASVIKRVQKVVDKGNGEMTLVLPYSRREPNPQGLGRRKCALTTGKHFAISAYSYSIFLCHNTFSLCRSCEAPLG